MLRKWAFSLLALIVMAACAPSGFDTKNDPFAAPGVAGQSDIDGLLVGHRLMAAGSLNLPSRLTLVRLPNKGSTSIRFLPWVRRICDLDDLGRQNAS